jgi:Uma2 family endonuclease
VAVIRDQLVPRAGAVLLGTAARTAMAGNDIQPTPPAVRRLHRYTYADYVALELESPTRHEFLDGEIYAIARGSQEHSALSAEVLRLFSRAAADQPVRAFPSHVRIYVEAVGLATFPDGCVIRGAFEQHPPSPRLTALNPMVLLEVTSDSSQECDTGFKLECYRTIPTLREYVLVSHRERNITVHERQEGGAWRSRVALAGGRVRIPSLKMELAVDEVYRKTSLA